MSDKLRRSNYNWKPDQDDDNSYVWNNGYWELCDNYEELTAEEESAYFKRQKRIEWDYYHPGEPCPKCEME